MPCFATLPWCCAFAFQQGRRDSRLRIQSLRAAAVPNTTKKGEDEVWLGPGREKFITHAPPSSSTDEDNDALCLLIAGVKLRGNEGGRDFVRLSHADVREVLAHGDVARRKGFGDNAWPFSDEAKESTQERNIRR